MTDHKSKKLVLSQVSVTKIRSMLQVRKVLSVLSLFTMERALKQHMLSEVDSR